MPGHLAVVHPAARQGLIVDPISQMRETEALRGQLVFPARVAELVSAPRNVYSRAWWNTEGFSPPAGVVGTCPLHIIRNQEP